MVKETRCLEASPDPLPKLGPLSACLTGGVVGVWISCKPSALDRYRDKRSWPWKVQRQSFPLCRPPPLFRSIFSPCLSTPTSFSLHLFSLPVNLSLSFTHIFPFLLLASPVRFHLSYSPSFTQKYLYYLFLFSAVVSVTHSLQVRSRSTEAQLDSNEGSESYRHRRALSFTYSNYVGSGLCTHNWYNSRENHQRLLVLQVTGYTEHPDESSLSVGLFTCSSKDHHITNSDGHGWSSNSVLFSDKKSNLSFIF